MIKGMANTRKGLLLRKGATVPASNSTDGMMGKPAKGSMASTGMTMCKGE